MQLDLHDGRNQRPPQHACAFARMRTLTTITLTLAEFACTTSFPPLQVTAQLSEVSQKRQAMLAQLDEAEAAFSRSFKPAAAPAAAGPAESAAGPAAVEALVAGQASLFADLLGSVGDLAQSMQQVQKLCMLQHAASAICAPVSNPNSYACPAMPPANCRPRPVCPPTWRRLASGLPTGRPRAVAASRRSRHSRAAMCLPTWRRRAPGLALGSPSRSKRLAYTSSSCRAAALTADVGAACQRRPVRCFCTVRANFPTHAAGVFS